jgi:hypothetical protein
MKKHIFWFIFLMVSPACSRNAKAANTYYVRTNGTASTCIANTDTVAGSRSTITAGILCMSGGDTLKVHGGTYHEFFDNIFPPGTAGAPTIIQAFDTTRMIEPVTIIPGPSGQKATFHLFGGTIGDDRYITIDGFIMDGTGADGNAIKANIGDLTVAGNDHITIQNNEIKNYPANVILASPTGDGWIIRNNHIHDYANDNGTYPQGLNSMYVQGSNMLIEGNLIHDSLHGSGINFWDADYPTFYSPTGITGVIIRNNTIYNFQQTTPGLDGGGGIACASNAANVTCDVYNNVMYNLAGPGSAMNANWLNTNQKWYNNTVFQAAHCAFINHPPGGSEFRNNICWNITGSLVDNDPSSGAVWTASNNLCSGPNTSQPGLGCSVNSNPLFVNASTNPAIADFRLQPGSPARNAGANLATAPPCGICNDIENKARGVTDANHPGGAWDMGAYVFGGSVAPPPNTPPLEDFVYTTSSALAGTNGGTNWTGPWINDGCVSSFTIQAAPAGSFSGGNAATSTGQSCASRAFTAVGTGSIIWQMSDTINNAGYRHVSLKDAAGNESALVAMKDDGHLHACADYPGDIDLGTYAAGSSPLIEVNFDATNQSMKARYRVNEGTYTAWTPFCVNMAAASLVDHMTLFDNTIVAHSFSVDTIGAKSTAVNFSSGPPAMVTSGVPFSTTVDVVYSNGVTKHASATDTISIAICTGSPPATLTGTTSLAATAGAATFNLTLTQPAGAVGVTLCASATGLVGDESIPITIPTANPPVTAVPALVRARIRAR